MPVVTPLITWAFIGLVFTNLVTLTLWRVEVSHHSLTKTEHAEQAVKAAQAATARLAEAAAINTRIVAEVARQERQITQLNQEKNNALRQVTTGRRCLDAAAVRLLNHAGPGPVSGSGSEPLPAATTFASDQDVGEWIAGARQAYDTCRARIDGIASFYADKQ